MRKSRSAFRWNNKVLGSNLDLIYLAHGPRKWGSSTSDPATSSWQNTAWNYSVVPQGSPHKLDIDGTSLTFHEGEMIIIKPGVRISIPKQKPTTFQIMNWLWKAPPIPELSSLMEKSWLKFRLSEPTLVQIRMIHAASQREVQQPDTLSHFALQLIHRQLDLLLARHCTRPASAPATRYELALNFLHNHPEIHNPVSALADYLEVSHSTIKRIFHQAGDSHIRERCLSIRMNEARKRLQADESVKAVALSLGYRHPNDFSRAYAIFFGTSPKSERR